MIQSNDINGDYAIKDAIPFDYQKLRSNQNNGDKPKH